MTFSIPQLEDRFLKPEGWRWGFFKNQGRTLRFGTLMPANEKPAAMIVCLTGLSEYAEKYFETARTVQGMTCGFWIMDWMGQGRSDRYLSNPHKRHSLGFQKDVDDLHEFIKAHILPAAQSTPLILVAHSMGGNIGLHYLHQYPEVFNAALFSAPMCGIKAVNALPAPLLTIITTTMNLLASGCYVGKNGDWREDMRDVKGHDPFSSDPVRRKIHNAWCLADPRLQVGRVTYGWVHHAAQSCIHLQRKMKRRTLKLPVIFAIAGDESFVCNKMTRKIAQSSPSIRVIEIETSRHEICMENDAIRNRFFEALASLIRQT